MVSAEGILITVCYGLEHKLIVSAKGVLYYSLLWFRT